MVIQFAPRRRGPTCGPRAAASWPAPGAGREA